MWTNVSFLQNNNTSEIINKILQDILQVFKAGRAYIIEYDSEIKTQTCTFEVVDNNIEKEQTLITDLATTDNVWWTEQIMSGHSIVLSTLDDLPEEAASEKEFLALQSIKSLIVVPLVSPQGAWGYVGIDVVEDFHQWSDEDCQWFTSLVNIINIYIELQKSRQEAQTERDYLQNLYKHMPLGYLRARILYDQQQNPVDLLFTDANLAAKKITGKSNFNGLRASSLGLDFSSNLLQLTTLSPNKDYLDDTHFVMNGPADLLGNLTNMSMTPWLYVIFAYYILATLLPIDKIIGKIYPFMGLALIFMAVAVGSYLLYGGFSGKLYIEELTFDTMKNMHADPANNILFPMLFIVISCGAISGFHATQSPMMARCMTDEKYGRPIFYGAMISEGIVAMIWATAAMAYFGGAEGLNAAATAGKTPAIIVDAICNSWLGRFGAIIAIIGVVVCPITSGDTAFRSMRLIIADALKFNQKPIKNRLIVSIPIFIIAYLLCNVDFSTIWKYVGIGNQVLATITLWTAATYLAKKGKAHWMMSIPATFLSIVCTTYFLIAPYKVGGLYLSSSISYPIGAIVGIGLFVLFITKITKNK